MARLVDWVGTYSSGGPNSKAGVYRGSGNHHQKKDPGGGGRFSFHPCPACPAPSPAARPCQPCSTVRVPASGPEFAPFHRGSGRLLATVQAQPSPPTWLRAPGRWAGDVLGWGCADRARRPGRRTSEKPRWLRGFWTHLGAARVWGRARRLSSVLHLLISIGPFITKSNNARGRTKLASIIRND